MILNIDKHEENSLAVIDSAGDKLRYGELRAFFQRIKAELFLVVLSCSFLRVMMWEELPGV